MAADFQPTLRQWLASEGGAVPFRRFMEAALYDPNFGYYARQIRSVGAQGDFSTSATLSTYWSCRSYWSCWTFGSLSPCWTSRSCWTYSTLGTEESSSSLSPCWTSWSCWT